MIKALFQSRKAVVALLVIVLSFGALITEHARWSEVEELLKWILVSWLGSVAVEDAAKHVAGGMQKKPNAEDLKATKQIPRVIVTHENPEAE